jgi:D-glycerate 3-kinase
MNDGEFIKNICTRLMDVCTDSTKIIGIAGPQGAGKSTLSHEIRRGLLESGVVSIILCIDDFYYSQAKRQSLAGISPLLNVRGVPGTHNTSLLTDVINRIKSNRAITWPKFNKATDDMDPDEVHKFTPINGTPPQLVILEGWCIGCLPLSEGTLKTPINSLYGIHY